MADIFGFKRRNRDNLKVGHNASATVNNSSDSSSELSSFVKKLSSYYCQFLETDFKKGREPKRKFANRDRSDRKIGIRSSKYPKFQTLLSQKINSTNPTDFSIKPRQYKSNLSLVVKESINASIDTLDMSPLEGDFLTLYDSISKLLSTKDVNVEEALEELITAIRYIIDNRIVSPVLDIVAPIFEKQNNSSIALDQMENYADEIANILMVNAEESLPYAVAEFNAKQDGESLNSIFNELKDIEFYKESLKHYFAEYVAEDVFTELRELIATEKLSENTQFYINIGEVKTSKSTFPLYCVPVDITINEGKISISFDAQMYANKKAIDFIIGKISIEHKIKTTNPITDRIFYKTSATSYVDLANTTFHKILVALHVDGDVLLSENSKMAGRGATGITVTNEISLSLADKSDESIVNDYEAMMAGLEGGDNLLAVFSDIIDNFLSSNPISIEEEIDEGWIETDVTERLVFMSPLPLAEEQRKILSAINNKDSKFISVEGPPGTGKSHTIAAIAFEMILNGKNILILSDKKEALNVVENKIEEVLSKVRGKETSFVNPILRLGKTGSNYSNIIKHTSINKLKVAQRTFKSQEEQFNKDFDITSEQLKNDIESSASAGSNIEIGEIGDYYELKNKFFENFPEIKGIYSKEINYLVTLQLMKQFVENNRKDFATLFAGSNKAKLALYLDLIDVINDSSTYESTIRKYPKINLDKVNHISELVEDIRNARGIFGYIFASTKLQKISKILKEITGASITDPQKIIPELNELCLLKDELISLLTQYGKNESSVGELKDFLISKLRVNKNDRNIISKYLELDEELLKHASLPTDIDAFLQSEGPLNEVLNYFKELNEVESNIVNNFNEIPDFDYLRNKTLIESLNSQLLANTIDKRVIRFATDRKADAKELSKIIRSKTKFPTDKFDTLKEAFPCVIAGLRDFAEYIPLEPDLFDLVIIDEASQVSIAQALPAILRAKKMIVMGDRKQYSNVKTSQASKELNQGYFDEVRKEFERTIAKGDVGLMTRFGTFDITNSVMEFFDMVSNFQIQLRKHFRGYPEMISFSSEYFYDNYLQVLKIRGKPIEEVIEFIEVDDFERYEPYKNTSQQEIERIIDELNKLLEHENPPSVGIITPYSAQQKLLSSKINDHENFPEFQSKLKLAIFTFDTCQGEERDIIMYSMVASRQADRLNYVFPLNIRGLPEDEIDGRIKFQRLNVGFSRGKEKLVFILSKPINEFKGSIGQALRHYKKIVDDVKDVKEEDVDENSPMEKRLLDWIKNTSFYTKYLDIIEIIPQFPIGQYLKSIDPGYQHPNYKVDFLVRVTIDSDVHQFIIEYDGFAYHFVNGDSANSLNWRSYLTTGDVERECTLESYGYKMIRVNRFNLGVDPVSTLDERLNSLINEYVNLKKKVGAISRLQEQTIEHINGLEGKTHRECRECKKIKPMAEFYDFSLKSEYGFICITCKGPNYKSHKPRKYKTDNQSLRINKRQCIRCHKSKPMSDFYDDGLKSNYGVMCNTCKGPGYSARRARNNAYWARRR